MQRSLLLVLAGLAALVASLASLAALSLALAPARRHAGPQHAGLVLAPREVPRGAPLPAAVEVPRAPPPPPPGQARASPPSPTVTVPAVIIHGAAARRLAARDDVPWRCGPWTALASGPITQTVRYCAASRVASTR